MSLTLKIGQCSYLVSISHHPSGLGSLDIRLTDELDSDDIYQCGWWVWYQSHIVMEHGTLFVFSVQLHPSGLGSLDLGLLDSGLLWLWLRPVIHSSHTLSLGLASVICNNIHQIHWDVYGNKVIEEKNISSEKFISLCLCHLSWFVFCDKLLKLKHQRNI